MQIHVPYSLADESNAEAIYAHVQTQTKNAFDYMIAEGFINDYNFMVNQAVIGV